MQTPEARGPGGAAIKDCVLSPPSSSGLVMWAKTDERKEWDEFKRFL